MRGLVRAEVRVDAPARVVWDYVTHWQRQGEWIPLTRVELVPPDRPDGARRTGGTYRAWTGLGPVGFWDPITVTVWEERADGSGRCEIMHTGRVVRGDAEFAVHAVGPTTCRVTLWEHLEVPGSRVGGLLWRLVSRFLDRGATQVLRRMAGRAEALHREGGRA